jgi:DNA modification methylase
MMYNGDCLEVMKNIEPYTIDLVVVDLPYGQTVCKWDVVIDLKEMWKQLKRIGKDNCQYVFFTTTKFGNDLIHSNPLWFRYDIVWEKTNTVGYLSANKMPLRSHEMIYIFSNPSPHDVRVIRNLDLREYAKNILKYIGKTNTQIERDFGNKKTSHFFGCVSTSQFSLPTEKTYNELIEKYNIDKMEGFIKYEDLKYNSINHTYNPQKTPGKPYKTAAHKKKNMNIYGQTEVPEHENKTGDRHPTSIVKFNKDVGLHPTQKPVQLCEWLIKTYSNEGDLVLDFCMGSGSTIVAAINTNRNYIGIEKDEEIFKIAEKRITGQDASRVPTPEGG